MAREFNINFNNVEMTEGMDGLLENTQVTKVKFKGENDLKSLKNTFKDCPNLIAIEGDINLKEVKEIDCMLEGTPSIEINLINVESLESAINSLTTAKTIVIKGDSYKKEALQNLLASLDWMSKQYTFDGVVGENVYTVSETKNGENEFYIQDSLELRNEGIEIIGETYNNQLRDGDTLNYLSDYQEYVIDENTNELTNTKAEKLAIKEIRGNTYQNLIDKNVANKLVEKNEYKMNQEVTFASSDKDELLNIVEIQGATFKNLNNNINMKKQTSESFYIDITGENNTFETNVDTIDINEIVGNSKEGNHVGELNVTENGDAILDENGNRSYILKINIQNERNTTKSIILPMTLKRQGDIADRLYWDYNREHYCIEKNIEEDMSILTEPIIIELPTSQKINLNSVGVSTIITNGVFPSSIKISNKQVAYSVGEMESEKSYSIQFKVLGSLGDSDVTSNNLDDIGLVIEKETSNSNVSVENNSIIMDGNGRDSDDSYISLNLMKIFPSITDEDWEFSCNFSVNSVKENQSIVLQCGNSENEGFSINVKPYVGTGTISITYNNTNKLYSITIQGAITHNSENVAFATNIENLFEILVKNCKITFTNVTLKSGDIVYIGEGENRGKRLNRLDFVFKNTKIEILPNNKSYEHMNIHMVQKVSQNDYFEFFGEGISVKDFLIIEGENVPNQEYFVGTKELGELKNEEYLIILTSNNYDWAWDNL